MLEIEGNLQRSLQRLRALDHSILDIENTGWCTEFNT